MENWMDKDNQYLERQSKRVQRTLAGNDDKAFREFESQQQFVSQSVNFKHG